MRAGPGAGTSWLVDFIKKAQASGSQCPLDVNVTVMYGPKDAKDVQNRTYDPLLSQALAAARLDVLSGILKGFGASVRVTANTTKGLVNMVTVDARGAQDKEKPRLETNSKPPKGTKVQPGQQIVVTMVARDDANQWQSGIKTVTLVADSEGDRLIAGPTYPPHSVAGCTGTPPVREVRATYIVPANPPPVVRLTATAMDHVGLADSDVGEFPTGDFYGTFTQVSFTVGRDVFRTRADIVLNHDGKGNLTGTMTGQNEHVDYSTGGCSFRMVQPGRFRVGLVGSSTERSSPKEGPALKVFIGKIDETALRAEGRCQGSGIKPIGPPGGWTFKVGVWGADVLLGSPSPLGEGEVLADGTRQYKWRHETGGVGTAGTVTLHRTRD